MRMYFSILIGSLIVLAACAESTKSPTTLPSEIQSSQQSNDAVFLAPLAQDSISSPVLVKGKARGHWFSEGSLPLELRDSKNNLIATTAATAEGEWMTNDFVSFSATLDFTTTEKIGSLILKKDNPSGMPEHDDAVSIPVKIQ